MKVKFVPQDIEFDIKPGQSVMHLAHDNGIHIKSVCKGIPSCAECRVRVLEGEHNVLPPSNAELSLIGTAYFVDRRRLSCQLKCFGDVTIDLSEQIEKAEQVAKRPRGRVSRAEDEESHAIQGTLVLDEKMDEEPVMAGGETSQGTPPRRGSPRPPMRPQKPAPNQKPKKDFYGGFLGSGGEATKPDSNGGRPRRGSGGGGQPAGGPPRQGKPGGGQPRGGRPGGQGAQASAGGQGRGSGRPGGSGGSGGSGGQSSGGGPSRGGGSSGSSAQGSGGGSGQGGGGNRRRRRR